MRLQQQDVAVGQALGAGQRVGADHIAGQLDVATQLLPQRRGDRRQRQLRVRGTLGTAEVRGDDHLGTGLGQCFQRRDRGDDATRIGDVALVIEGDVEIGADQDTTSRNPF
ncbi:hypothetical protein BHQ19_20490 [Mycolicibacterium porcinum]|nr:hypothetical protein BHQ19_20490 [Mycolicibacterium porcinum]